MRIQRLVVLCVSVMIILFLNSCFKRSLSNDKYLQFGRSYLGDELTSHFPDDDVWGKYAAGIDTVAYYNTIDMSLTLFNADADKRIKKVLDEYKNKKLYSDNDSCIVVLNDFLNEKDILNIEDVINPTPDAYDPNLDYTKIYKSKIYKNCKDKYEVIPNFWEGYYIDSTYKDQIATTRSRLDRDFKFIIIDSEFSDKKVWMSKINPEKSYMPNPIKHGYSRGIAFNEKEKIIIYWIIFW